MSIPIEQAVPDALQALLIAALPALNTLLRADSLLNALPQPLYDVPSTAVLVGDQLDLWDVAKQRIIIAVSPGDFRSGTVENSSRLYVEANPNAGWQYDITTSIYAYLHPDVFQIKNGPKQAQSRLRAQLLVGGWMRQTLQDWLLGQEIKLASTERVNTALELVEPASVVYGQPWASAGQPLTDHLSKAMVQSVIRGVYGLGFGADIMCYGVHCLHTGTIQ